MIVMNRTFRAIFFICFDIFLSFVSFVLASLLRFSGDIPNEFYKGVILGMILMTFLRIVFLWFYRVYMVPWRFFGIYEAKKIFIANLLSAISFFTIFSLFTDIFSPFPRSVILIDFVLSIFFIGVLRISKRMLLDKSKNKNSNVACIVVGISSRTKHVLQGMKHGDINYYAEALFDDTGDFTGSYFENFTIMSMDKLEEVAKSNGITTAIIAKNFSPKELLNLHEKLLSYSIVDIKIFSLVGKEKTSLRDISINDLLARKPKDLDNDFVQKFIQNKTVLITGAGGSIGTQLSILCDKFGARELILIDNCEFNLYQIGEKLKNNVALKLTDITNFKDLEVIFNQYKPQVILHAGAYKHVWMCELNKKSAVFNNILGTKNLVDLSIKYGVNKFVLISTDKAVSPTSVMGATKRICELYCLNSNINDITQISAVRFGNVLGSSGSVIPKFQEQIKNNQALSVTHPDVKRYFMLTSEACQLVLQAAQISKGGELFVLDMGEPVKIVDLANKMLQLSNKEYLGIKFTGLKEGEKLFEELLTDEEHKKTRFESIFVAQSTQCDINELNLAIQDLLCQTDDCKIVEKIRQIVPEFNHKG